MRQSAAGSEKWEAVRLRFRAEMGGFHSFPAALRATHVEVWATPPPTRFFSKTLWATRSGTRTRNQGPKTENPRPALRARGQACLLGLYTLPTGKTGKRVFPER